MGGKARTMICIGHAPLGAPTSPSAHTRAKRSGAAPSALTFARGLGPQHAPACCEMVVLVAVWLRTFVAGVPALVGRKPDARGASGEVGGPLWVKLGRKDSGR